MTIALHEKRIILTRDIDILKYNDVGFGYWVRNIYVREQLAEVIRHFGLAGQMKPLTRCSVCNSLLVPVEKTSLKGLADEATIFRFDHFMRCAGCSKIYWQGSHCERMASWLSGLTGRQIQVN